MTHGLKNRFQDENGIALVIVMTAVLIFMILVVEFTYSTRVQYNMALNSRDQLQAEYLAKSGVSMSLLLLRVQKYLDEKVCTGNTVTLSICQETLYDQIPMDTSLLRGAMAFSEAPAAKEKTPGERLTNAQEKTITNFLDFHGDFSSQIKGQGMLNLNELANSNPVANSTEVPPPLISDLTMNQLIALVDPEDYDAIFEEQGLSRIEVLENIRDWVDEDSDRRIGGYEDTVYAQKNPPYKVKNAKFDTLGELALVEGVNQAFLDAFLPSLTIYGKGVNINQAEDEILDALISSLLDIGGNEAEIEKVRDWILENRKFNGKQGFVSSMDVLGYDINDMKADVLETLTYNTDYFSITATGMIGADLEEGNAPRTIKKTIHAVAFYQQSGTSQNYRGDFDIVYWRIQ